MNKEKYQGIEMDYVFIGELKNEKFNLKLWLKDTHLYILLVDMYWGLIKRDYKFKDTMPCGRYFCRDCGGKYLRKND
jgi:hypothetical protein